jgi:hypothetical protein
VTDKNDGKPFNKNDVTDVTDENGGRAKKGDSGPHVMDDNGEEPGPSTPRPGLSPHAVDQLARGFSGLKTSSAAQLEDAIRTRLAKSGMPVEAHDVEVEKVVRRIEALDHGRKFPCPCRQASRCWWNDRGPAQHSRRPEHPGVFAALAGARCDRRGGK